MKKINKITKLQKKALIILTTLRLIFPLVIFLNPVWGAIVMFFLDLIDYQILVGLYKIKRVTYELYDKLLDHYGYVLILIYLILNLNKTDIVLYFSIGYFLLRTIGEVIFSITKNEKMLLLFPNIFEFYFWLWLYDPELIATFGQNLKILGLFLLPIKIVHEYVVHFLEWSPSKMWTSKIKIKK